MEDKIMVGRRKDAGTRSYLAQEMQDGSMDSKKMGNMLSVSILPSVVAEAGFKSTLPPSVTC